MKPDYARLSASDKQRLAACFVNINESDMKSIMANVRSSYFPPNSIPVSLVSRSTGARRPRISNQPASRSAPPPSEPASHAFSAVASPASVVLRLPAERGRLLRPPRARRELVAKRRRHAKFTARKASRLSLMERTRR